MVLGQDPFEYVRNWHDALGRTGWWHSFELPGGRKISGVSTVAAQKARISQFPIPGDLRGKRVLDVGTWDGWFAMEMERRGAEVMAVDRFENPRLYEIRELLGSRVDYQQLSVYDLSPERVGRFDIVLFMGVLYHLKHPLLALERVCSVASDLVAIESFVLKDRHARGLSLETRPLMEFYENDEFGGEFDNWWAPTAPCLLGLCRTAGFVRVELNAIHEYGAALTCYRTWGPVAENQPHAQVLNLASAFNTATGGINFDSKSSEEYVSCLVAPCGEELAVGSVWPEVGDYAAAPVFVGLANGSWQVNFKLPPGLLSGWHKVRLQSARGVSNVVEIAVDVPPIAPELAIESVCDGVDWQPWRISLHNRFASLWIRGLPNNADRHNVRVSIAGRHQITIYVEPVNLGGVRQVNIRVAGNIPVGRKQLELRFGPITAPAVAVEIAP